MMSSAKNELGQQGEALAVDFLIKKGYKILEKNYRMKFGEIDIVAKDGETVCFVEVKTRTDGDRGTPWESVTFAKQRNLSRLALAYLKHRYKSIDVCARFDVIAVSFEEDPKGEVELLKNAFDFCLYTPGG